MLANRDLFPIPVQADLVAIKDIVPDARPGHPNQ